MLKRIIIPLAILAFILRIIFIFQGGVSFHYDMARDAYEAQQIWKENNLKILGPPTSTTGLYHGVLYYYLIAPFYMLGNGDPRIVAIFLSFINTLVVIPIIILAKDIFKKGKWVFLAGFLFAVSFEATQYASWISNPQPAVLTIAIFFLCLYYWKKGKEKGLYFAVLTAALSTQFQFFLIYLFLLIPLFGMLFKIKANPKQICISGLVGILGLINFIIAIIKFKTFGNTFISLINIPAGGQIDFRSQFSELALNYFNKISELFTYNFFPTNVFLGGILAFTVLYLIRRQYLLLFYLLSNLPIFIFGGHTNTYANIGLVIPAILAVTFVLKKVWAVSKMFVFVFMILSIVSNLLAITKYNPEGQIILVIPNDMNIKQQLKLVDQTYKLADGKQFSINTLTLPLWINTTWAYLYSWYGKGKYGYLPDFYGRNQIGLLGADSLRKIDKPLKISFFIIEPTEGIPIGFYNQEIEAENIKTELTKEINYGSIKLQIRIPKNSE